MTSNIILVSSVQHNDSLSLSLSGYVSVYIYIYVVK